MGAATCLASEDDLPGVSLMSASDALFGVCKDWVHQKTRIHLNRIIYKESKLQAIWKTYLPAQIYDVPSGRVGKTFVSTLTADLNGRRGQKWSADRVIILKMVILQHTRLVICA